MDPPGNEELVVLGLFGFVALIVLVALVIQAFVCYLLMKYMSALPEQYQRLAPGLSWLLMIPCFSIVWNFIFYINLSKSYQDCFNAGGGSPEAGDCGFGLAIAYCVCSAVSIVPYMGVLFGLAGLVLLILYLVKMSTLSKQVASRPPQAAFD